MTRRERQRGNMVAAVSAIGMAGTLAISAVMNSAVVLEERAIDAHLAEVRAYWGAMGQFNYALSRTAYDRGCGVLPLLCPNQGTDVAKAGVVQSYLNELRDLGFARLTYPEESAANYFITVAVTAAQDDTPGKQARTGHLMMTSGFGAGGTAPALDNAAARLPRYEMRFCVGIDDPDDNCNSMGNNSGGRYTDDYRIKRLTRLPN